MTNQSLDIHCIAIGGTGMAPLACLLQELGHRVRGSDGPLYPPMSTLLETASITPRVGFDPAHLDPPPDLVVVGNAVPRHNPEAVATEASGLERISMPQAVARFLLHGRRSLVVAGTHGKTTTTSLAAWVYTRCGADPGFLIGGVPQNLPASFRLGGGERFVIEGDEYNASYFDRGPKFLHYQPQTLLLTSVEYDHADLYPTPESLLEAYRALVRLVPEDGLVVAWGDAPEVREVAAAAGCPTVLYGLEETNDLHPEGGAAGVEEGPDGCRFRLEGQTVDLQISGRHNVLNSLAVWAAARADGIAAAHVATALKEFRGVQRRLQELGTTAGVTVIDDFAHHPTAVGASLAALRRKFPGRRLVSLFEPRSLTAGRRMFQESYRQAFAGADRVLLAPIFHAGRLEEGEGLDLPVLVSELAEAGIEAVACASVDEVLERAVQGARAGDVLVTMSSGSFEGLPRRLLEALERR